MKALYEKQLDDVLGRMKLLVRDIRNLKDKNEKLLERISGMCGNPNASDGCRNILELIKGSK